MPQGLQKNTSNLHKQQGLQVICVACHEPHLDAHVKRVQTLQPLKGDGDGVPSPTVGAPNAKAAINADAAHAQVQRHVSKNELQEAQGRCT